MSTQTRASIACNRAVSSMSISMNRSVTSETSQLASKLYATEYERWRFTTS